MIFKSSDVEYRFYFRKLLFSKHVNVGIDSILRQYPWELTFLNSLLF